jgi:hypothetical protein
MPMHCVVSRVTSMLCYIFSRQELSFTYVGRTLGEIHWISVCKNSRNLIGREQKR